MLLARITSVYEILPEEVTVGDETFSLIAVRDTNALLEGISPEQFARNERLPFWADLWASSLELARFCLERPDMAGTRVLELGCGVGLGGIAALRAGAQVTMTDYEPDALLFAEYNALTNIVPENLEGRVEFRLLDWRDEPIGRDYDLVIGADITYERTAFSPLLATLRGAVRPGGEIALTDPDRAIGGEFIALAAASGFRAERARTAICRRGRTTPIVRTLLIPQP